VASRPSIIFSTERQEIEVSNVLAFPSLRPACVGRSGIFDDAEIQAFVIRNAVCNPERVEDLKRKLQLATKAAGLLGHLVDTIRLDLDLDKIEGHS
jgi:hypothetical protein